MSLSEGERWICKSEQRNTVFTLMRLSPYSVEGRFSTSNLICQLSKVSCVSELWWCLPWEFMPNGALPATVTAHESYCESRMIKPLQGHDLLSFLKLLLTVPEAVPLSGLAPLSLGHVCRCVTITSVSSSI